MEPRIETTSIVRRPKTLWYRIALVTLIPAAFLAGFFIAQGESYSAPEIPGSRKVSPDEANALFNNYYKKGAYYCDTLKGFHLSFDEIGIIRDFMSNESVKGIHTYYGLDREQLVKIIVGCDERGRDIVEKIIVLNVTSRELCPTICDVTSPITIIRE